MVILLAAVGLLAQEAIPYDQKIDVVYGEAHGTGLLMDVFTPRQKANGLGIIDVASGAYYSDRVNSMLCAPGRNAVGGAQGESYK